jgi:ATP-dependent Clp protease ATP-binding subunit ClpX
VQYEVPSNPAAPRHVIPREVVLENVNPTLVPRQAPAKRTPREKSA